MLQTQAISRTPRTKQLLVKLYLAIDEAKLVIKIAGLNDELRVIENMPDQFLRAYFLKNKISTLESELWAIRNQME